MGLTELLLQIQTVEIGSVILDASVREKHTSKSTPTRHPVEAEDDNQLAVTDHVHVEPLQIQIEGIVTNTPANWFSGFSIPPGSDPVQEAYEQLTEYREQGTLIDIQTTLRDYSNMVIESVDVDRDADKGNALFVRITASEVRLVESTTVDLDTTSAVAGATKVAGKAAGKAAGATAGGGMRSALTQGLISLGALPK